MDTQSVKEYLYVEDAVDYDQILKPVSVNKNSLLSEDGNDS